VKKMGSVSKILLLEKVLALVQWLAKVPTVFDLPLC